MGTQLKTATLSTLFQTARERFEELSKREQRLVTGGLAVAALALVWLVAVEPALDTLTKTQGALAAKQAQAGRVVALADTITALKEQGGRRAQAGEAPVNVLTARVELMKWLERATVTDRGDGIYAVDLNEVPAVDALDWLDSTERLTGLVLQNLSIEKVSTGIVNVRSQWNRGAAGGTTP
jgi:type II secretory pathway component PulM